VRINVPQMPLSLGHMVIVLAVLYDYTSRRFAKGLSPKIMMRKHSGAQQRGDDRKMKKKVATFGACCTLQTAGRPFPSGVS
jgi:hypothetical protein